jgi:hypothetical protein
MIQNDINEASEHVAAELVGLRSELEILHIPAELEVSKFASVFPQYYSGSFSAEACDLARRLMEERFIERGAGLTTEDVREAILESLETRDAYLAGKE